VGELSARGTDRPPVELPVLPRVPFQLIHYRGLLVGLVLTSALLVVATASGSLYLSSAADRAASLELEALRGRPTLTVSAYGPLTAEYATEATGALGRWLGRLPDLDPMVPSITGIQVGVAGPTGSVSSEVAARAGFLRHVRTVASSAGPGIWIPATLAAHADVTAGGRLTVAAGGTIRDVPVAGVYGDLDRSRLDAFWRTLFPTAEPSLRPLILGEPDAVVGTLGGLVPTARFRWDALIASTTTTLSDLQRLTAGVTRLRSSLAVPGSPVSSVLAGEGGVVPFSDTPLPRAVAASIEARDELRSSTAAIALAGVVIALAAMAASGAYATRRRRIQANLLSVRGLGPLGQGALALVEAVVPVAFGAAAGWLAVVALVRLFGPSSSIDPAARTEAFADSLRAAAAGLVLYAVGAGIAARREFDAVRARTGRMLARAPWEPVVLVLAGASFYELSTRPIAASPAPDLLLLLFPILFVAGVAGLAVRLLPRAISLVRGRVPPRRMSAYLAVRRLAAATRPSLLLVTGTAVAIGALVYAGALSGTVDRTARARAIVAAGSDVSLPLERANSDPLVTAPPPGAAPESTLVVRLGSGRLAPGGPVDVIAVDPATFEHGARWDRSFTDVPLARVLRDLTRGGHDRIQAIVAGAGAPRTAGLVVQGAHVAVAVVDRVHTFPGMRKAGTPLVIVDRDAVLAAAPRLERSKSTTVELWERGDERALLAELERAAVPTGAAVTLSGISNRPDLLALSWTIQLLLALGITAAFVALAAMVLFVQARQESRELAFALGRRMGLTDRAHRRALSLELGCLLGAAAALGSVLAVTAALLIRSKLRVLPELPGPTVPALPWTLLLVVTVGTAATALMGGWLAQRRARRANVAEVIRVAG
jgi:putative ABC transport system permease protein